MAQLYPFSPTFNLNNGYVRSRLATLEITHRIETEQDGYMRHFVTVTEKYKL